MMTEAEIVQRFLDDTRDRITRFERQIDSLSVCEQMLPAIGTVKQTCAFLGLAELGSAADLLEKAVRDVCRGAIELDSGSISLLKQRVCAIRGALEDRDAAHDVAAGQQPALNHHARLCDTSVGSALGGVPGVGNALGGVPGTPHRTATAGESAERHRGRSLQSAPPSARVLVVSESRFFRHLLAATLEGRSYQVTTAASLAAATAAVESSEPFDLIVADLETSAGRGCELGGRFQQLPHACGTRLIGFASSDHPRETGAPAPEGFDRLLVKFSTGEFVAAVDQLVRAEQTEQPPATTAGPAFSNRACAAHVDAA